jgi:hypothetical protein
MLVCFSIMLQSLPEYRAADATLPPIAAAEMSLEKRILRVFTQKLEGDCPEIAGNFETQRKKKRRAARAFELRALFK